VFVNWTLIDQTIGFDPVVSKDAAREFNVDKLELEEIWPLADYITVHTPYMPQTHSNYLSLCYASIPDHWALRHG
jgi:hypothetical protein